MPIVPIDTLAAGDVFHGSFGVALAEHWPLDRAIEFASVAAGIKCRTFGGRLGAPTRAEHLRGARSRPIESYQE